MNYKPKSQYYFKGPFQSKKDGGQNAEVEIETGEAVIGPANKVTIFGGAKANTISSRGFMVDGARHGQKNTAGTSGIPLASQESVYVASAKINSKGWDDKKNSQAKEAKKFLKYYEKAEQNPQDKFLNNPEALAMLDNEMKIMEQKHNEGRFMKGLHDLTKKKNRSFEEIMQYIMQQAPNEGAAMMGQQGPDMTPGINTGAPNEQAPIEQPEMDPNTAQGMDLQQMPQAQLGGNFGGSTARPDDRFLDPSTMSMEQRHQFNMQNGIYQLGGYTTALGQGMNKKDARFHKKMKRRFGSDAYNSYMDTHQYSGPMTMADRRDMRKNLKFGPKVVNNYYGSYNQPSFGSYQPQSTQPTQKPMRDFTYGTPQNNDNSLGMFQSGLMEYAYGGQMFPGKSTMYQQPSNGTSGFSDFQHGNTYQMYNKPAFMMYGGTHNPYRGMNDNLRNNQNYHDHSNVGPTYNNNPVSKAMPTNYKGYRQYYQEGGRATMDQAMQQHRQDVMQLPQQLQQGPAVQTKDVNPSSVSPTSQYQGYGVMANQQRESLPWQLDNLVKKHKAPAVSKGTPKQDLRTMANLADKEGAAPSGLSNFLPKRMTQLYSEDFKGWDNIGDDQSGVLTEKGRQKAKAAGMSDAEIDATDWTNFDKSELYNKVYKDNISDKTKAYHQAKTYGTSASALGDRSQDYKNVGELALSDMKGLRKGESFNQEGANSGYRRAMNDAIHDGIYDPSLSDKENAARLNAYLKNSEYSRNVNQHFDKKMKRGSEAKEIDRQATTTLGHTEQSGQKDPTKVDMAKGKDGERVSFRQAFKKAKQMGLPTFTWNGRIYLGKTESETTDKEKAGLAKAKGSYTNPQPSGDSTPGGWETELKIKPGQNQSAMARQATGQMETAPTPGQQISNQGEFTVRNQGTFLRRSSRRNGGYVQPMKNGQRITFQKGGRTYSGTVNNYDPYTGDFDLI